MNVRYQLRKRKSTTSIHGILHTSHRAAYRFYRSTVVFLFFVEAKAVDEIATSTSLFNNEFYMAFLLDSQAQGVSGKNEQSTQTPRRGGANTAASV